MDTADRSTPDHLRLSDRDQRLRRMARFLPLVMAAAWIVTIFVPVLDSANETGPRITITSLGDSGTGADYPEPGFVACGFVLLVFAALALLLKAPRWWSAAAVLVGVGMVIGLVYVLLDPPLLMWDGVTVDGLPTGGMEVAYPAAGYILWVLGSGALVAAGTCGLIAGSSRADAD